MIPSTVGLQQENVIGSGNDMTFIQAQSHDIFTGKLT